MFFFDDRNVAGPTVKLNGVKRCFKSKRFDSVRRCHGFKRAQDLQTNALPELRRTDIDSFDECGLWIQLTECDDISTNLFHEYSFPLNRSVICFGGSRGAPVFYLCPWIMQRGLCPNCTYAGLQYFRGIRDFGESEHSSGYEVIEVRCAKLTGAENWEASPNTAKAASRLSLHRRRNTSSIAVAPHQA